MSLIFNVIFWELLLDIIIVMDSILFSIFILFSSIINLISNIILQYYYYYPMKVINNCNSYAQVEAYLILKCIYTNTYPVGITRGLKCKVQCL